MRGFLFQIRQLVAHILGIFLLKLGFTTLTAVKDQQRRKTGTSKCWATFEAL